MAHYVGTTMNPFDLFETQDYIFLQLESGTGGNKVVQEYEANGIVRLREGMVQDGLTEAYDSSSTVHIRPSEPFVAALEGNLVGHGMRINNYAGEPLDYRITGPSQAPDYDEGTYPFYKVTLKKESLWQDESELPIE